MEILEKSLISPEQEVVLGAIRIDHEQDDRVNYLLGGNLNWSYIQDFSIRQGVLPQLYTRLKFLEEKNDKKQVPDETMKDLGDLYLTNAQRNIRLTLMILRVLNLLTDGGSQCMPIKGPVLAKQLYGDIAMRHFTDLDVLIQAKDFQRCYEILTREGFIPKFPLKKEEESWLLQADSEFQFTYQGDLLEIHWGIAEKGVQYPLKEAQLWNNVLPGKLHGQKIFTLSLENLFFMLCIHGIKHMWSKLIWIADLAHFINANPDIDWFYILDRAKTIGFHRITCLGLLLSEKLGGAMLPVEISMRIRSNPKTEQLAKEVCATLFNKNQIYEKNEIFFFLRCRERVIDRIYFILDQALKPKQIDWQTISLPPLLFPLYYLIRPMRLIYKFAILPITSR